MHLLEYSSEKHLTQFQTTSRGKGENTVFLCLLDSKNRKKIFYMFRTNKNKTWMMDLDSSRTKNTNPETFTINILLFQQSSGQNLR